MHESYANPNRVVSKPPFEVSERGSGEFEIQIRIYFNDLTDNAQILLCLLYIPSGISINGNFIPQQHVRDKGESWYSLMRQIFKDLVWMLSERTNVTQ